MAEFIPIFNASIVNHRNDRVFRERPDILAMYRDVEIVSRYRLNKATIQHLIALVDADLRPKTNRSHPVSTEVQVLSGLRYLGKGDFFSEVSDLHGISKATSARLFNAFIASINRRVNTIRFPTTEVEKKQTMCHFYQLAGMPGVLGAIDGTLVPIIAPKTDSQVFICRKQFCAINVQAVVDSSMRFTDVVARWPGSQHDAAIWNSCALKTHMETQTSGYLLGDSGYPLKPYLMTPVLNAQSQAEERYNAKHAKTRVVVERAFGVLKSRFRCLHKSGGCLPFSPDKACHVVTACMRLHNMCIDQNIPLPDNCEMSNEICNTDIVDDNNNNPGQTIRRSLINRLH